MSACIHYIGVEVNNETGAVVVMPELHRQDILAGG